MSKSNSSKTVDSISVSMKKTEKLLKEIEAMEKAGTLQEPMPHTIRKRSKLTWKFWKYFIWWKNSQDKIMLVMAIINQKFMYLVNPILDFAGGKSVKIKLK